MTDVKSFLDEFKKTRDFKAVFPLLIGDDSFRKAVFEQIGPNEYPYAEYASWIATHFFEKYPEYFETWVPFFRKILFTTTNHTVQRNLVNPFIHNKVKLEEDGEFLELLINFLQSAESLPALKVNAFKAIEKQYLKAYPELISELGLLMDLHKEDTRPSIQSLRRYYTRRYATKWY